MKTKSVSTNSFFDASKIDPDELLEILASLQASVSRLLRLFDPAFRSPLEDQESEQDQWGHGK